MRPAWGRPTPKKGQYVPFSGPVPALGLVLGEAPGFDEAREGQGFVGKAGTVLDDALRDFGIRRSRLRIGNCCLHWPGPGNPDPSPEDIERWRPEVEREIQLAKPRSVLAVGRFALDWLLPGFDLGTHHGFGYTVYVGNHRCVVVPCFHPAGGFYQPKNFVYFRDDVKGFAEALNGKARRPPTDIVEAVYGESNSVPCRSGHRLGMDTESGGGRLHSIQWSAAPGIGACVDIRSKRTVHDVPPSTIWQNSPFDIPALAEVGIRVPWPWDDTMVAAFVLGDIQMGLKEGAYRDLGMTMEAYEDVVRPHFEAASARWLERALGLPWPKAEYSLKEDPATGLMIPTKPHGISTRLKTGARSKDRNKWWGDLPENYRRAMVAECGPFPEFSLRVVPKRKAVWYAGRDPDATRRWWPVLKKRLKERGQWGAYQIHMAALPGFLEMQSNGLPISYPALVELKQELEASAWKIRQSLQKMSGSSSFNPNGSEQCAEFLFGRMGLRPVKLTKGGGGNSTDDSVLEALIGDPKTNEDQKRALVAITEYREQRGIVTDNLEVFPRTMRRVPDHPGASTGHDRLFFKWKLTTQASGRAGAEDPNVLSIPSRTTLGKRVRKLFKAPPGWKWIAADESQLEMRVIAHESEDPELIEIFQKGLDIYLQTARRVWKDHTITKESAERQAAKIMTLAWIYMISEMGLYTQYRRNHINAYTESQCRGILDEQNRLYRKVPVYWKRTIARCKERGYVESMFGWRRWLPTINASHRGVAAEAERAAVNLPIQAGGVDIIKRAIPRVLQIWRDNLPPGAVDMVLYIHDELVGLAKERYAEEALYLMRIAMESDSGLLRVPLKTSGAMADSWGDLEK